MVTPQASGLCRRSSSPGSFLGNALLTGEELHDVAMAKKSTGGGLDGWAWSEVKALS